MRAKFSVILVAGMCQLPLIAWITVAAFNIDIYVDSPTHLSWFASYVRSCAVMLGSATMFT